MRLIDADDFIERLHNAPMIQEAIRKAMDCMPTIDAVRIIRCKDCISFRTDEGGITYCASMGVEMHPEDFCSYGERK